MSGFGGSRRSWCRSSDVTRAGVRARCSAERMGVKVRCGRRRWGLLSSHPREWDDGPSCSQGLAPEGRPAALPRGRKALDFQGSGTERTPWGPSYPWGWEALGLELLSPGDGKALPLGTAPPQPQSHSCFSVFIKLFSAEL